MIFNIMNYKIYVFLLIFFIKIMLLFCMICAIVKETAKKETAEERKKRVALRDITEKKEKEAKESVKYTLPKATEIILRYIRKENHFFSRIYYLENIKLLENEIIDKCLNDKSIFATLCGKKRNRELNDVLDLCFSNDNRFFNDNQLKDKIRTISRLQKLFKMDLKLNLNELDATLLQYYCTTDIDLNKVMEEIEQKSSVNIKFQLLSALKEMVGEEKWKNILEKKTNVIYKIFQAENFINLIEKLKVYTSRTYYIIQLKEIIGHETFEKEIMTNLPILYEVICNSSHDTFRDALLYLYNNVNHLYDRCSSIEKKIKNINKLRLILGDGTFHKEIEKNIKNIYRFLGEDFGTDTFDKLYKTSKSKRWTLLLKLKETFGEIIFKNDLPLMDLYKLILGEEDFEKIKNEKNIHIEVLKKVVGDGGYYGLMNSTTRKLLKYKKLLGKYFFDIFKENSMEITKLIFRKKSDEIITIKDIFQLIRLNSSSLQDYWDRLLQIKELFGDYWNQFVKENLNEYYRHLCFVEKS